MRLIFSCLLSLGAHLALLFAPTWLSDAPAPLPLNTSIKATLRHTPAALPPLADTQTSTPKNQKRGVETADTPLADTQTSTPKNSATSNLSKPPLPAAPKSVPKNLPRPALRRAQTMLSKHLFYPPSAVTQGLEGEVVLLLTLDAVGQILAVGIAKSSGHALLDEAALDAARHIGALPGNPRQTLLPVTFQLQ